MYSPGSEAACMQTFAPPERIHCLSVQPLHTLSSEFRHASAAQAVAPVANSIMIVSFDTVNSSTLKQQAHCVYCTTKDVYDKQVAQ